jgi:hypothetical protein
MGYITNLHAVNLGSSIDLADDLNAHVVWLLAPQAKTLHPATSHVAVSSSSNYSVQVLLSTIQLVYSELSTSSRARQGVLH